MRVTIVGTGYVGLVTGACFSVMGNKVSCVDLDVKKVEALNQGKVPIYEPGLEKIVLEKVNKNLFFTTDIGDSLNESDVCFIAVGTPMGEDGSADMKYVEAVARTIGEKLEKPIVVVNKSTVPVGTADRVSEIISEALLKRQIDVAFDVVSNPEFLKEGAAISDFMSPDRIVIGAENERSIRLMRELYGPFVHNHDRLMIMDKRSAEMTKYTANAMLATKISFMNEIANICETVGADVNAVRMGIGSDQRIGYHFIYPGCGYGGSCFPKDVRALKKTATEHSCGTAILSAVEQVNESQKYSLSKKIVDKLGEDLSDKVFAVWGLAFKPETDDMREAPSIITINELTKRGARIRAYDPKAMNEAREHYLKDNNAVTYVDDKYVALDDVDAMILITEWKEFRSPDFVEMKKRMDHALIFDGRNQYREEWLLEMGFEYHQIGKQAG